MSIHIPQVFLHGHATGHNGNYLVNKYSSGSYSVSSGGNSSTPIKEMRFKFEEDTSNYFYNELSKILNVNAKNEDQTNGNQASQNENVIVSQSSPDTNTDTDTDNIDNICLITKEKLQPNHITLNCKHKFNYLPIYFEVVNQKNKQNNMYEITKLLTNEIKCPYCRAITYKLLPYIPYPSVKVVKNVNSYITSSYNSNSDYFLYAPKCCHGGPETENPCQKYAVYYEKENMLLCPQHYKTYLLKQKTGNKKISKESAKDAPKGVSNDETGCCAILKSGKNIGRKCRMTCIEGEKMKYCKKHYKMLYSNT
jgi:hypothetical protein